MNQSFMAKNENGVIHLLTAALLGGVIMLALYILTIQPKLTPNIKPQVNPLPITRVTNIASESARIQEERLNKYFVVEAALLGVSNNVSLYFKDLNQNRDVSIDPTKSWIPASTIKSYVILEAFRQRRLGLISFKSEVTIKPENVVPTELETDEFPRLRADTTVTIQQLVEAMIIQSDNTAYNTLLDILDRRNINSTLKNIGLTETVVGEKLNIDSDQLAKDLQVLGRQPNTTTVKDLVSFFDLLYNHKYSDSEEMLAIFKRQKINNMIPALLPADTIVAHKTGDWAPIYHDGGIVYKASNPFSLAIFTNTGDPSVVAKIARVAYYQTPDVVGEGTSSNNLPPKSSSTHKLIYLADSNLESVLGVKTDDKFPIVTASDLGITTSDLQLKSVDSKKFRGALITPRSMLYDLKRSFENLQTKFALTKDAEVRNHLLLAKSRLAEAKTLITNNDISLANDLLKQSELELESATNQAKNSPNKDLLLTEVKNTSDLHFATLAERSTVVDSEHKEQFVDTVYNFLTENQQRVKPIINSSIIANPTEQKPAIGTITQIQGNEANLKFDDGTSKQILIPEDTKIRAFQEENYQNIAQLKEGDKIAVIGQTNSESKIIPQFILTSVPEDLPNKHQGTVIEINPDQNTLKILDKKGKEELIEVDDQTSLKSKDTNVSLEGIKAGSQVTVFGVPESQGNISNNSSNFSLDFLAGQSGILKTVTDLFNNPSESTPSSITSPLPSPTTSSNINSLTPSPTAFASPQASNNIINPSLSSPGVKPQVKPSSLPQVNNSPATFPSQTQSPSVMLKATSVTVTNNSSGSKEKVQITQPINNQPTSQNQPKPQEPAKNDQHSKNDSQKDSKSQPTPAPKH